VELLGEGLRSNQSVADHIIRFVCRFDTEERLQNLRSFGAMEPGRGPKSMA
jgi:hypothetical protein